MQSAHAGEVVVQLPIDGARESQLFAATVEAFAKWLSEQPCMDGGDGPNGALFVRTEVSDARTRKVLTFEERRSAAAFLVFWRRQKRLR